jgi:hypothetical protein
MELDIVKVILGSLVTIIGYFLKATMTELKETKNMAIDTKLKVSVLENDQNHLTDKFDMLYQAVKDLTSEIKQLNVALSKKKDM